MQHNKTLPNTFIIGAPRCGTSAIFTNLIEHKDICGCKIKEPYFFNQKDKVIENIKLDSYINLFKHYNGEKASLEASPCYLYYKNTPYFIKETLGSQLKFIMVLRNPVDRAYSHFLLNKSLFNDLKNVDIETSLNEENERIKKNDIYLFHYKAVGMYYYQVKRYFDTFGKENCLVILFHEFQKDKLKTYRSIFKFLGVDKKFIPSSINSSINISSSYIKDNIFSNLLYKNFKFKNVLNLVAPEFIKNKAKKYLVEKSTSTKSIDKNLANSLKNYFRKDIDQLSILIDKDLSTWN
jgi:hypothetical protein